MAHSSNGCASAAVSARRNSLGMRPPAKPRRFTVRPCALLRRIASSLTAAVASFGLVCAPLFAEPGGGPAANRVLVDGHVLPPGSTQMIDGKQYILVRSLAYVLHADVATDSRTKTVTVTTLLRQVIFTLDNNTAVVNSQRVPLDAPPRSIGGRIFIPLRSLARTFAATVGYRRQDHSV